MVIKKQAYDSNQSFANWNNSQWFFDKGEPKSKSGKSRTFTIENFQM